METSELSGVVLRVFRRFTGNRRVKTESVDGNRGLEARIVVRSIFHGGVCWQAPPVLVAELLQLRLVHLLSLKYVLNFRARKD